MPKGLTEKQRRFVDFYIKTGNATESARLAGYRHPNSDGPTNTVKPSVRKAIDARMKKIESARIADAKEVMEFLTSVLRGQERENTTISRMRKGKSGKMEPTGSAKVISSGASVKDRVRAAELLAKRFGLDMPKPDGDEPVQFTFKPDE